MDAEEIMCAVPELTEEWRLHRRYFPSKCGGRPAWLIPANLPDPVELKCPQCQEGMNFLLQLYMPEPPEDRLDCFHRTYYLFGCQNCGQSFRVFRAQLPRENDHYEIQPAPDGLTDLADPDIEELCCPECGLPAPEGDIEVAEVVEEIVDEEDEEAPQSLLPKQKPQRLHGRCRNARIHQTVMARYPEFGLEVIVESEDEDENDAADDEEADDSEAIVNANIEMDESEEKAFEELGQESRTFHDKFFDKFLNVTSRICDQVVRVAMGGRPLWVSRMHQLAAEEVPDCERCGGPRQFLFQVHPTLIHVLSQPQFFGGDCRLDFALLAVYGCAESCDAGENYVEEFIFRQPEVEIRVANEEE